MGPILIAQYSLHTTPSQGLRHETFQISSVNEVKNVLSDLLGCTADNLKFTWVSAEMVF